MATLTVGTGQQYSTIAAAVAATQDGDTVLVQAGTYTNDFFTIARKITLQSLGGLAVINATAQPGNGKGAIVVDNDATIDGFGITGVTVPDANGAAIRYEAGHMVLRNSVLWNNQNGILANTDPNGTILIDNSEFSANGAGGSGYTHNIYINQIAALTVQNSYFHDVQVGHEIKSRALATTITGNRIQDNVGGTGSYSIDLPNGGTALIQNNTIEKGPNTENNFTIHFGGESNPYPNSSLAITGNTILSDNPNATLLLNQTTIPVTLTNNQTYGFTTDQIAQGPVLQSGNTRLATEPTLDLTTRAPAVLPPPAFVPPPLIPVPDISSGTVLTSFGPAGAVTATGHVLTVGHSGAQFTSLQAAVAAAVDGDTIDVAAGTYVNDFAVITHKVIIEGVGGLARFVQQNDQPQSAGILVVNNDATIKNMEFTGTSTWNGHAPGVHVNAGNVTLVNTLIDNNEVGLIAEGTQTTLSIYNSEIGLNGNSARGTNNVQVGAIGSLTIKGSYIHGATTGHEIYDDAFNTDIENTRIIDGDGIGASFLLDLAQGGNALLANNTFVKGNASQNGILIHAGGEGTTYANSDVRIDNNTLVTQLDNINHPYTYFIEANTGVTLPPVNASGNVFVGGIAGSRQLTNAIGSNNTTATAAVIDTSSPINPAAAPPLFAAATGPNKLTLKLSEDKGDTDAQYYASVDGKVVGGGVVTAARGGTAQAVTLYGSWSAGSHQVAVTFLNQQIGAGGGATNLYVESMSLGGDSATDPVGLNGPGVFTATLTSAPVAVVPQPTPPTSDTLDIHVSEDAWRGHAQFTVTIDGKTIGGTRTATASHAAGATQDVLLKGSWGAGLHVIGINFLNDAYGGTAATDRNLYIDKITYDGIAVAGAPTALLSNGTATFQAAAPAAAATIRLMLAEDAWMGDAQVAVQIDGATYIQNKAVTASNAKGLTQAVDVTAALTPGSHDVAVSFLNDAWGGSASTDRNLYVKGVLVNNAAVPGASATLLSTGTSHFTITVPTLG